MIFYKMKTIKYTITYVLKCEDGTMQYGELFVGNNRELAMKEYDRHSLYSNITNVSILKETTIVKRIK